MPVAPGPRGVLDLLPHLAVALDGSGPAIAPIPAVSATVAQDYVAALLRATRPDDSSAPLESPEVAVVACTSGSTGDPRGVLLTTANLTAHTARVNDGDPVWVVAIPVTSVGGLNVAVRSLATTHEPVPVSSVGGAEPFTATAFADAVTRAQAVDDHVRTSLVPAQLARLLEDPRGIDALRACRAILVGAAPTRSDLRMRAAELGIAVTTTYGATETSGGCVYDGMPLPGVQVQLADRDERGVGRVIVSGACVAAGYRLLPELSAELFTPGGFRTPDLGTLDGDGRLTVVGRVDDVVIIGGVNVSPHALEEVAARADGVRAAAAVTGEDAQGPWVALAIESDDAGTADAVRAAIIDVLGHAARPRWVRVVAGIPHLPNGKVDRARLLAEGGQ